MFEEEFTNADTRLQIKLLAIRMYELECMIRSQHGIVVQPRDEFFQDFTLAIEASQRNDKHH